MVTLTCIIYHTLAGMYVPCIIVTIVGYFLVLAEEGCSARSFRAVAVEDDGRFLLALSL